MSYQQEKFKEIADAIREKTGTEELIKPSEFKDKISEVFDAGKRTEHDEFWESFQQGGERSGYVYGFSGKHWTDDLYAPKYPITTSTYAGMYRNSAITDTIVPITFLKANTSGVFENADSLETIRSITVDENQTFSSWFTNCTFLKNISFVNCVIGNDIDLHWSPLSKESVENVVSALSDTAEGKTITFNDARMYAIHNEQCDKGIYTWWDDLRATKSNWYFELL